VELEDVPGGVRVVVRGETAAAGLRILANARYLEGASQRAKRPEEALGPAARQSCPVVLTDTRVVVKPLPRGADLIVTAGELKATAALRQQARQRLHRAFPLPKVSRWTCGAFTRAPTKGPQPHQARALFAASPEERLVPTGWDSGDTTVSNEAHANRAHIAFIQASPTPQGYQGLRATARRAEGLRVLRKRYATDPGLKKIEHAYVTAARFVTKRFGQLSRWAKQYRYDTWLTDGKLYGRIRRLALRGRIRALRGDLNGPRTLCGIGEAAKRMGVIIRILYPSNAEEYKVFRPYKWTFRRNVRNLPADSRSLVLRTYTFSPSRLPWPKGWKGVSKVGFHYNAQPLLGFQRLLNLPNLDIKKVMTKARDPDRDGFSMSKP
jgi:hypothetical protein